MTELSQVYVDLQPPMGSVEPEVSRKVNAVWQVRLANMTNSVRRLSTRNAAGQD